MKQHLGMLDGEQMNDADMATACSVRQCRDIAVISGVNVGTELQIQRHKVTVTFTSCNAQSWSAVQRLCQRVRISSGEQQQATNLQDTTANTELHEITYFEPT